MISKMTEQCILCGDIYVPTEKSVQHRNDLNYQRTLHPLRGHLNPNWKRQLSIEIITNLTKPYLICCDIQIPIDRTLPYNFFWDIQTPTAKDSSVSKWFQRWQNLTSFAGTFKFKIKKTIQYAKWFQRWQNLTFIAGTFKLKLIEPCIPCWDIQIPTEKDSSLSKWFQRWRKMTYFVGTFKFQLKKKLHYRNDYKDDRK